MTKHEPLVRANAGGVVGQYAAFGAPRAAAVLGRVRRLAHLPRMDFVALPSGDYRDAALRLSYERLGDPTALRKCRGPDVPPQISIMMTIWQKPANGE